MTVHYLRFHALDSLFFRESRPFGVAGGSELTSLFPPPARTLLGAVRTLLGEALGVDWEEYKKLNGAYRLNDVAVAEVIGYGDDLRRLRLHGPWLMSGAQPLYPAPLTLLYGGGGFRRLTPGPPVDCDLGEAVRLPILAEGAGGGKELEGVWLTAEVFAKCLAKQGIPEVHDLYRRRHVLTGDDRGKTIAVDDPRLGIARVNARRTVGPGMLYQTRHVRLADGISICVGIEGVDAGYVPAMGQLRLGGEGRIAAVERLDAAPPLPKAPEAGELREGLTLTLLTHARFTDGDWKPDGLIAGRDDNGCTVWRGTLHGIELSVVSAALGRSVREGGWDMLNHKPRSVVSLIPAGSTYFVTLPPGQDAGAAIEALHGKQIGEEQAMGRGLVAVGVW